MKIILCTFLLCITAVSVFGQSVELHGILGQSVKFPAAVEKRGFLMYGGVSIGAVDSGKFKTSRNENYRDRVKWDSSTGFFSLSGLKMEDIGEYKVQNNDQIIAVFQLNVSIPVSKPNVSITHNEYPCTIECTANRGTLSWYRKGQKKSFASSHGESAPHLNMMVESGTYTCEANNSFSNKTSDPLTVGAHCTAPSGSNTLGIVAGVSSVIAAVFFVTLIAVLIYFLRCHNRRKDAIIDGIERKIRDNFIYHPEPTEKMTSHQTEVPLNQATREVGEP